MACGSNIKTVMIVGDISREIFDTLIKKDNVRVLHLNGPKEFMNENDQYKRISGDLSNRIFIMALFLQFNFPVILSEKQLVSEELFTVCKEQWHGEYDSRSLIALAEEDSIYDLTCDEMSSGLLPLKSVTSQLDLLIKL